MGSQLTGSTLLSTPLGPIQGSESPCFPWAAPNPRLRAGELEPGISPQCRTPLLGIFCPGIPWGTALAETSPEFHSVCDCCFLSSPFLGVRPTSLSEDSPAPCLPQAFPSINLLQIEFHLCVHLSEDTDGLLTLTSHDTRTANNLPWALVSSSVKMDSENYKGFCKDWMRYICVCIYIYICVCVYNIYNHM